MTDRRYIVPSSDWLVATDGRFDLSAAPTAFPAADDQHKNWKKALRKRSRQLYEL